MVFDLNMLKKESLWISGNAWCTFLGSRIEKNTASSHSLDAAGKRIGYEKDKAVEDFIRKHKLWEWEERPYKKTRSKIKFYNKVPLEVIAPYGKRDARITRKLGIHQFGVMKKRLAYFKQQNHICHFQDHMEVENKLSKIVSKMYMRGVKVDLVFTQRALNDDLQQVEELSIEFIKASGFAWDDRDATWDAVFTMFGIEKEFTEKGNLKTDEKFFKKLDHPIADLVLKLRHHEKRIGTYFSSILHYGRSGILHGNLMPGGTVTGRFSSNEPNLQNIPRKDEGNPDLSVKKCFIPREDYIFVMIDYDQQELKLLFDYANEKEVIQRILNGEDAHQVTADMARITRKEAKAINFGLLYGMGLDSLAASLGVSKDKAKFTKERHLSSLNKVREFVARVQSTATRKGYLINWIGRKLNLPDRDKAFVMVNHLIQSSGADVCRKAMVQTGEYLDPFRSELILQIHDELLFEIHKDELHLVPDLKKIMEDAYIPRNGLPLTCSVEYSKKSWGDKLPWPDNPKQISKLEHLPN